MQVTELAIVICIAFSLLMAWILVASFQQNKSQSEYKKHLTRADALLQAQEVQAGRIQARIEKQEELLRRADNLLRRLEDQIDSGSRS